MVKANSKAKTKSEDKGTTAKVKAVINEISKKLTEMELPIELVDPPKKNTRTIFDQNYIAEIGNDIKAKGQIQAVVARKKPNGRYEIVVGECRWRGIKFVGLPTILARVGDLTDEEVYDWQISENLKRKDLHPLDESESYIYYLSNFKIGDRYLTVEELSLRVGKELKYLSNRIRLQYLIKEAREDLRNDLRLYGLALQLTKYEPEVQKEAYQKYFYETDWNANKIVLLKDKPRSVSYLREKVKAEILLDLNKAEFSKTSTELLPSGLACINCKQRTGYEPSFFPELQESDYCQNIACFQTKRKNNVSLKCREIALEKIVADTKGKYQKTIEKATEEAKTSNNDQAKLSTKARLEAELNEVEKFGAKSSFVSVDETKLTKLAEKVVMISNEYYSKDNILGRDSYTAIDNPKMACNYAIKAVYATGSKIGEPQLICKSKDCPKHHASSSSYNNRVSKSGDELKERNFELYNIRTADTARKLLFAEGKSQFDGKNPIWTNPTFQKLMISIIFSYSNEHNTSHRARLVADLLGKEIKEIEGSSTYPFDNQIFTTFAQLEKFDDDFLNQLAFLLTVVSFGENQYEGKVKQDAVHWLAKELGVDFKLVDAQARIDTCQTKPTYKKFAPIAENYLEAVKKGKKVEPVNYWIAEALPTEISPELSEENSEEKAETATGKTKAKTAKSK